MRSRRELKTATGDRLCEDRVWSLGARDHNGMIHFSEVLTALANRVAWYTLHALPE